MIIEGLALSLGKRGIEVVAQAPSVADVVERYEASNPDVVVMDVGFGQSATGLDAARDLMARNAAARVVFYTQYDQDEIIREAYRIAGAPPAGS